MTTTNSTAQLVLLLCLSALPLAGARAQAFHAGEYGCALVYFPTPDALKARGYPDSMSNSRDALLHDSLDARLELAAWAAYKTVDDSAKATSYSNQYLLERSIKAAEHFQALARLREPIPAPGMDACEVLRDRGEPSRVTRTQAAGGYQSASWWYEEGDHAHLVTLKPDARGRWWVDTVVW